jgi:hypothetical protein
MVGGPNFAPQCRQPGNGTPFLSKFQPLIPFLQNGQRLHLKSMKSVGVPTMMGKTDQSQPCGPTVFMPWCSGRYLKYQFAQPVASTIIQPTERNSRRRRPKDSVTVIAAKSMPMSKGPRCDSQEYSAATPPPRLPSARCHVTLKLQPYTEWPTPVNRQNRLLISQCLIESRTGDRRRHPNPEEYTHDH